MPWMLFVIYVFIYVGVRSFKPKKTKKKGFFGHFAMCRGHGTRQSDHMGRPGTAHCRVPSPCALGAAHGEAALSTWPTTSFAMCLLTGHTAKPGFSSCVHGADTWRTTADAVNWP